MWFWQNVLTETTLLIKEIEMEKFKYEVPAKYVSLLDYCLDPMADGSCYLYGAKFANYSKSGNVYEFDKERACKIFGRQVRYAIEDYELEQSNPQEHVYARENYLMKLEDDACEQSYLNHEASML